MYFKQLDHYPQINRDSQQRLILSLGYTPLIVGAGDRGADDSGGVRGGA
jgi:hypothetical protein